MTDYDFRILQPSEFECFSRDLLQARENIFIESFADGRDKGIDLRFAYDKDKTCIVQCKRYKEWQELKGNLKNEIEKVKRLNPQRYILTTSVDLTVGQKTEIVSMFTPYILNNTDVLGRKDLNNLLNLHKDIEKDYHKLWLASTNVLNLIINKSTVNWSSFELEKIEREIRLYVENKSLSQALEILKENHYVVISGIPGIGKTTLAYILVYTMLAQGFEEFVCITDDVDNAAKMFEKEKRQIFFFDDFLGSNSFVQQSVSFENKLLTFIEKVKNNQNTLFILSTREYVLSEAMTHYEKLAMSNIDLAKCTIQLEHYTKTIKARILYNHLAEANIPAEYINTFLEKHGYRELVEHKNFNPRVIESIIKDQIWDAITPSEFTVKIKEFFDNPISVWQFAFDKLDMATRYALLVLGTMGNIVMLDDFQQAYKTFCSLTRDEIGLTYDDVTWRQSLKVLSNCFIKTEARRGVQLVSMYNPSIADFVVSYLNNNHNTVVRLITGACFIEQLYYVFTDNAEMANTNNQVLVGEVDFPMLYDSFNRIWNQWKTCQLNEKCWNEVKRENFWETRVLYDFMTKYPDFGDYYDGFLEKRYDIEELTCGPIEMKYRVRMMELIDWDKLDSSASEHLAKIVENEPLNTDEWIELAGVIDMFGLEKDIMNKYCYDKLDDDLYDDIKDLSDLYDCDEYDKKIDKLRELLPNWSWHWTYSMLTDVEEHLREEENEQKDTKEADIKYDSWKAQKEKEDSQIDEMFSALRVYN
jgi:Holliday junction resolvasome RuvABC ATP-dependent DNA helicase subunit